MAFEISGCQLVGGTTYTLVGIGEMCSGGGGYESTGMDCTPGGSGGDMYTFGSPTISGPGAANVGVDGTVTASRTGAGTISVSVPGTHKWCVPGLKPQYYHTTFTETVIFND